MAFSGTPPWKDLGYTEMEWKGSGMQSGTVQLSTDEKGEMKITVSIVTAEGNISLSGSFQ